MKTKSIWRRSAGFTLIETCVAIAIFGLVLTAIGLEFVSVVDHTLHTRADSDAESQARLIMARVSGHMRTAYFDVTDFPTMPAVKAVPVVSPVPLSSPTSSVTFYRVSKGGLATPVPVCSPGTPNQGSPCPPFELVTIALSTSNPGELDEMIAPQGAGAGAPSSPMPIGNNVTNFGVTALSNKQYNVTITVSEPSGHCVANACSFTLDNVIYVGGQE